MGKPPETIVSNGRANPVGIPYLYATSDINTAIAEVRPSKGETVSVAEFKVKTVLILADLRNPKQTISPFELEDDDLIQLYQDMPFLTHLGEELSKFIVPREAELEYLPSQYLCEFIKHIGFHGVIYRSSLDSDDNYAIFDDSLVKCTKMMKCRVTGTGVTWEKYKV